MPSNGGPTVALDRNHFVVGAHDSDKIKLDISKLRREVRTWVTTYAPHLVPAGEPGKSIPIF